MIANTTGARLGDAGVESPEPVEDNGVGDPGE